MNEPATGGVAPALVRRWWVVGAGVLLGLLLGFAALQVFPATYTGTAILLIKGVPGTGSGANLSAAQYAISRASSYPSFINSNVVQAGVSADMNDGTAERELRDSLSATNPPDTPLVNITARGSTGEQAQARANSAARHMARFISQIETVGGVSPVLVEIAVQADLPAEPSSPRPLVVLGIGVTGGFALGAVAAFILDEFARRRRAVGEHPPARLLPTDRKGKAS